MSASSGDLFSPADGARIAILRTADQLRRSVPLRRRQPLQGHSVERLALRLSPLSDLMRTNRQRPSSSAGWSQYHQVRITTYGAPHVGLFEPCRDAGTAYGVGPNRRLVIPWLKSRRS